VNDKINNGYGPIFFFFGNTIRSRSLIATETLAITIDLID